MWAWRAAAGIGKQERLAGRSMWSNVRRGLALQACDIYIYTPCVHIGGGGGEGLHEDGEDGAYAAGAYPSVPPSVRPSVRRG